MSYVYAVDGQVLKQQSIDAGDKWSLTNALGSPFRAWDALGQRTRVEVDELQRPTHVWVKKGAEGDWLASRVYYGEAFADPEVDNLRGKAVLAFDGAGLVETSSFDFKGNVLTWARTLATAYESEPDWSVVATEAAADAKSTAASLLESETFSKAFAYDALSRVTSATMPDSSEIVPSYNEAGQLAAVDVKIRGDSTATTFVENIDYDAHGRRTVIEYGNGTSTEYTYDELTFRLVRLRTVRASDSKVLQDLKYTFDPAGNIVEVHDDAHEDVFFNDSQVEPTQQYDYDALYRLVAASGREHAGGVGDDQRDENDLPLWDLPHPNNAAALRRYNEAYTYDKVGNLLEFFHEGVNGPPSATWTRTYRYGAGLTSGYADNRLHSTSVPGPAWASYTHDANGNMDSMPHLASIEHTHRDQMRHADLGGGGDAYYTYNGGDERVRKFIQRTGTTTEERIYLGGWELYCKRTGASQDIEVERETLHVMDDTRRIAMAETLTVDAGDVVSTPVPRIRYQYGNHLESAMLECDESGDVISYEEYHPYGTAAYRSAKSGVEVSEKRYRYTGKERDEETGFTYHRWRYYAPWLGRWTAADPKRPEKPGDAGLGRYTYAGGRVIVAVDSDGLDYDLIVTQSSITVVVKILVLYGGDEKPDTPGKIKHFAEKYWAAKSWSHTDAQGVKRDVKFDFQITQETRDEAIARLQKKALGKAEHRNEVQIHPLTATQLTSHPGAAALTSGTAGDWPADNLSPPSPNSGLNVVIAHEIGHLLGLDHVDDNVTSVQTAGTPIPLMHVYAGATWFPNQVSVQQSDIDQIVSPGTASKELAISKTHEEKQIHQAMEQNVLSAGSARPGEWSVASRARDPETWEMMQREALVEANRAESAKLKSIDTQHKVRVEVNHYGQ